MMIPLLLEKDSASVKSGQAICQTIRTGFAEAMAPGAQDFINHSCDLSKPFTISGTIDEGVACCIKK
jgi:hypothetical protein